MRFSKNIRIGKKNVNDNSPVFIIAEAGVNHGGDISLAMKLIDIASEVGADAVKFQAFRTEHLILNKVRKAPYQMSTTDKNESQYNMLKKLEIRKEHYIELKNYCLKKIFYFLLPLLMKLV